MSAISAWLDKLGLGSYAAVFVENAIDIDVLPNLDETDLEKLGVALGDRKRILRAVTALTGGWPSQANALATAPVQPSESERRHLTVLFCDIVGSTALAVELDAEQLSGVIRRFQKDCTGIIVHNSGYVARFVGDGLLAYFGYPHAHEDDAENAARAGLHLVAKVNQLLLPSGEPLQLRVAIATGLVVVETIEGSAREKAVLGETPNLAARLQTLAPSNSVVVAESTRKLLGEDFVCEPLGSFVVKGLPEPVIASRVIGERVLESRFEAKRGKRLTQFIGRQNELQQLLDLWSQAKRGSGQVALLCGEPGIGKSRITIAFFDQLKDDQHITIRHQCSSHHIRSPFYPVIRYLTNAAGFEQNDSPEAKLDKLETVLSPGRSKIPSAMGLFASLLSIPDAGRYPTLDLTPKQRKDLTISALNQQLAAIAASQPVLMVFEDVHWIDPTTLELIGSTIGSIQKVPVLLVITYRPEFFPPWLDQSHVRTLRLERLGRVQVEAIIADITGGKELPAEVLDQIVSKTDGVPLFVEELTKTVLESGLFKISGGRYVAQHSMPAVAVPTTLHDSLMARLDRLAPVKEIAQIGSVIGREFSYRLLSAVAPIAGPELESALMQLGGADLIHSRGQPPEATYSFKHALVQDTAYSSLMPGKRRQFHGRIATALKEQFSETVETQPELMAHHLEQAGMIEPAIEYIRIAGQRAIERSANAEAIGHLKHGLELLHLIPVSGRRDRLALALEVTLGQAMIAARGYAATETEETLLRARALLDESTEPSQKFAVLYGLWACYYVGGKVDIQHRTASEFLEEAERHGGDAELCLARRLVGTTCISMGQFDAAREHLELARALYDPEQHASLRYQYGQDIGATALCYLSWALWHLGYVDQACKVADEAVKHAETLAHPFTLAYTIAHARGMMDVFRRSPNEARAYAGQVVSICTELGFPFWTAGGRILDGWAATCEGDDARTGLETLRAGLAAWRNTGARLWLPMFIAIEAEAHSKVGHRGAALRAIEEAVSTATETGERWAMAEVLRIKARVLRAAPRAKADEVESLLTDSMKIARRQQARCWELRAACDLAQHWQEQGRESEASKLLRSIYDQFTEGFDTTDLVNARAIMDGLKPRSKPKPGRAKKSGTRRVSAGAGGSRRRRPPSRAKSHGGNP
jgi:predicted ATPase/class 3 adenylate cyclase